MAGTLLLDWKWDYSTPAWSNSWTALGQEPYVISGTPSDEGLLARHGSEHWVLHDRRLEVHVHAECGPRPYAVMTRKLLKPYELQFHDGRRVTLDTGGWLPTLKKRFRFKSGKEELLVMSESHLKLSGRRVKVKFSEAGEAFPDRTLLLFLGFHRMIFEDRKI